jgi:hypothetical protein
MNHKFRSIRQILAALILIGAVAGFSSCEKYSYAPPSINTADTVHFNTEIQPIFTAKCLTCHGTLRAPDLRVGHSFEALTNLGFITPPGLTSGLYVKLTTGDHIPRTTDLEKQKFLVWINQGAKNN